MEALKIEHLSKHFGGVCAVNDVSFTIEEAQRVAIIGPNGAGKTTLLNLVNGQLAPTVGHIYFFGQDVTDMSTYRRAHLGVSRSFQIISLFLNLTVLENALLAFHGIKPSRFHMFRSNKSYENILAKAKDLLVEEELWDRRDELVKNISYGEQRRLELALSLAAVPKLLLLDEPSCGLTVSECSDMVTLIRKLAKDVTVVFVAHDMDLVFGAAERIIVVHFGEIIADGTPEEIRTNRRVYEIYMGIEEGSDSAGIS